MRKMMISVLCLIVCASLLFVVGCTPQIKCEAPSKIIGNKCCVDMNDNNVCDSEEEIPEVEVEEEPEPEPEPEVVFEPEPEVEEEPELSEYEQYLEGLSAPERSKIVGVRQLVEEALEREENLFYRYTDDKILQDEYWVRGDKIKLQFLEPDELDKFTTYNLVYIDRGTGKAEGYCETGGESRCWAGHGPFEETTSRLRRTPKDWIKELGVEFAYSSQNKINDVIYYIIDYKTDDGLYRVWIEGWKGWPTRVELHKDGNTETDPDVRWMYTHMDIGGTSEDDVVPG
ncbi:hypothetical protein ACFL0V_00955 [Nanoarchaeota archaeon]